MESDPAGWDRVEVTSQSRDLRTLLTDLFTSCASSVAVKLGELGMSPTEVVTAYTVVRTEPSMSVEPYVTTGNPLRDRAIEDHHAPWLPPSDIDALHEVAAALRDECRSTLPFFSPPAGRRWLLISTAEEPRRATELCR
jgi:hypothetical protein